MLRSLVLIHVLCVLQALSSHSRNQFQEIRNVFVMLVTMNRPPMLHPLVPRAPWEQTAYNLGKMMEIYKPLMDGGYNETVLCLNGFTDAFM